jgi:ketosteroid isomerase-like protein
MDSARSAAASNAEPGLAFGECEQQAREKSERRGESVSEHPNAAIIRSAYEAMDKADVAAFAAMLDDDITWYESTSGIEGVYRGRDEVMAFLGQVFQQPGMQMSIAIHDILANDEHAVFLHESTITVGDRSHTGQYADVYHLRDGKITAHWHLAVDAKADAEFASRAFAS